MTNPWKKYFLSKPALIAAAALTGLVILMVILYTQVLFPTLDREAGSPEEALRPVRFLAPDLEDDLPLESLEQAIRKNLDYLERLEPDHVFSYGADSVTCETVRKTQEDFLDLLARGLNPEDLENEIKDHFILYRATGRKGHRQVLFTGYFEPVYDGSLKPDDTYRYPLYHRPSDLLRIDLSPFGSEFQGKRITARIEGRNLLPYHARQDIEEKGALEGRGLEFVWLKDPVDVAFLHIQGSGRIHLPDGSTISVGYAGSNGRSYRSIGRYMIDHGYVTREAMSMQAIREYLSTHPDVRDEVLNHNPSYVFFDRKPNGPFGNINVPLTPGRSIALDSRLFPKGALCFMASSKPVIGEGEIQEWTDFSRFVVNQDTGGAIRGAGRADLFWGSGPHAELAAGHMKHEGELYVIVKKKE